MLPIRDDQPRYSFPVINSFLIGINLVVFLFEASLSPRSLSGLVSQLGVVPSHVFGFVSAGGHYSLLSITLPFLTSMFLHGSWMHVTSNMWFLYIFGDNVEDYLGHFRYLIFYFVVGILAMLTQALSDPHSTVATLGASGAIAGVLGAYFMLYPKARVLTWFPIFFVFYLPAWAVLGLWFVIQFFMGTATSLVYEGKSVGGVAFWAHVGGFVAGAVLIKLLPSRRRRSPY